MGNPGTDVDVVIVGAGFSGLYLLHRMRASGFSAVVLEAADDVGGTWYWNRYPGARCDIQSLDYSYSWDPELERQWEWSERYATQPEILRYANHVADTHDLRRDIRFETRVEHAEWDDTTDTWAVHTTPGDVIRGRYYVMATGCLSVPKDPDIDGHERYQGETYFTGRWPHEKVDFSGKRVAVIGTGSSAIQSIPLIAEEAAQLTVFQRTPNYTMPAWNGPVRQEKLDRYRGREAEYREEARWSPAGVPDQLGEVGTLMVSDDERQEAFERMWARGELFAPGIEFSDISLNPDANELLCEFIRSKIGELVDDPVTAETLSPRGHYWGTKRPCIDTDYYRTFNRPNVRLVDLRRTPIATITETGIDTTEESMAFDAIVYAIGFDAMTGPIVGVDIRGRGGVKLADEWADGPHTYLGLTSVGFPNLFMITGPGSPSVLSNMMVSIEQHVDWITECMVDMREGDFDTIEPTPTAQDGWGRHVNDCAGITLHPTANSWYMGANVPGKPRVFLPYIGGVGTYRAACDDVVAQGYLGFTRRGRDGEVTNDGVVRRLQRDVMGMLEVMEELGLPPLETLPPPDARAFMTASLAARPAPPQVGEVVDGTLPGADGELCYRLYRPATDGPHPVAVYFHGGGWVIGDLDSDDPLCRYLCNEADALVVSVDYRHGPEHRFPAAHDDAWAATQWVAENVGRLGGDPTRLAVAGWSVGGNLAASTAIRARDEGGPELCGQVLVNAVTDSDWSRPSFEEAGEGYVLTRPMMEYFFDHYLDERDRTDPRLAVLRADDLSGLPPALVVTAEFDPLRDEGSAYVEALDAAGSEARELPLRGQIHTSIGAVGIIRSADGARAEIASTLKGYLTAR